MPRSNPKFYTPKWQATANILKTRIQQKGVFRKQQVSSCGSHSSSDIQIQARIVPSGWCAILQGVAQIPRRKVSTESPLS